MPTGRIDLPSWLPAVPKDYGCGPWLLHWRIDSQTRQESSQIAPPAPSSPTWKQQQNTQEDVQQQPRKWNTDDAATNHVNTKDRRRNRQQYCSNTPQEKETDPNRNEEEAEVNDTRYIMATYLLGLSVCREQKEADDACQDRKTPKNSKADGIISSLIARWRLCRTIHARPMRLTMLSGRTRLQKDKVGLDSTFLARASAEVAPRQFESRLLSTSCGGC